MRTWIRFLLIVASLLAPVNVRADWKDWLGGIELGLEAEREQLVCTLDSLPKEPTRHLTERLGFHSGYSSIRSTVEWIEMNLRSVETIDAIVLIPAPSNSGASAPPGYGFPVRFRVELSPELASDERILIADYSKADFPNPGALPVYLPANGAKAKAVRITVTKLFREDNRYFCALGEIMILQGKRNIACRLSRGDINAGRTAGAMPVWGMSNLFDGHTVLGPPVGNEPSKCFGYQSALVNLMKEPNPEPRWVQVDLGKSYPIDEIRLFPAHPPDFSHRQGYGYPILAKLEISDDPTFTQATLLPNFEVRTAGAVIRDAVNPGDNVVSYPGLAQFGRYVRFTGLELHDANGRYNIALGEMQVWSGDENVALRKPVTAFDSTEEKGWSRQGLNDGYNSQANIVDWRDWLAGLSTRRETIEALADLDRRQAEASYRLRVLLACLAGSTALVTTGYFLLSLVRQRSRRRQEIEALRQRIAQDLHDEIGSSLGSIALISQDALDNAHDPEAVRRELEEIQSIARQTVDSMRDIVRLIASKKSTVDLGAHLEEIANRLLRLVKHRVEVDANDSLRRLPPDRQRELVLMYKEALHNIVRHADASEVLINVVRNNGSVVVSIEDDGRGFDTTTPSTGMGLVNLRRRAEKLGGDVVVRSAPGEGAKVMVTFPAHE